MAMSAQFNLYGSSGSSHSAANCTIPFCRQHAHLRPQPKPIIPPYGDGYVAEPTVDVDPNEFGSIPYVPENLGIPTVPVKKRSAEPQTFYAVSYIRDVWMNKLQNVGIGRKTIRYFLSDETLCLGTKEAPPTSDFYRPLVFHEAYFPQETPDKAKVYMTEFQVDWLVDELYARIAGKGGNTPFSQVDVDRSQRIHRNSFAAIRKISFANNVASFRRKCGLSVITKPITAPAGVPVIPVQPLLALPSDSTSTPQDVRTASSSKISSPASSHPTAAAFHHQSRSKIIALPDPPRAVPPAVVSFQGLSRTERQAFQRAYREANLVQQIAYLKACLPVYRQLYEYIVMNGGSVLACDVESWTEDADVLLELGLAWKQWMVVDGAGSVQSGNDHYIIEETVQYRNEEIEATRYDYGLGSSLTLPQSEVSDRLRSIIARFSSAGPLIMVFHDASAETRYFQRLGIDPTGYHTTIPREMFSGGAGGISKGDQIIMIQDTQDLYCGWSDPPVKQINLGKACAVLGVEASKLHNAGNDADATLQVWEKLLRSEGTQGEARISNGVEP